MLVMIRCNHCGKDHRHDYCITTGKIPSEDCIESDIELSPFLGDAVILKGRGEK